MQCSGNSAGFPAGVYYLPDRGDEKRRSKEAVEDSHMDEDSAQRVFLGFQHFPDECIEAQLDRGVTEDPPAITGAKHNKDETFSDKLTKIKLHEQEPDGHRFLMVKYEDMKEFVKQNADLRKECEQERQAHRLLQEEHDKKMKVVKQDQEELEASLAKAQQATHNAAMANCRLKSDYFSLMEHVKFVHECKKKSEREALRTHISHVETIKRLKGEAAEVIEKMTQEQQDYNALWFRYEKTEEALAETRDTVDMVIDFYNELKHVNSILREEVETLRESVKELGGKLHEDHKTRVKLFKSTLELENINLKDQVTTQQVLVNNLERQLQEARFTHEQRPNSYLEKKSRCNSAPLFSNATTLRLPCVKIRKRVTNTRGQNENITPNEVKIKNPCSVSHEDIGEPQYEKAGLPPDISATGILRKDKYKKKIEDRDSTD